jgi:DNA (cytosine-5)-methyltransferase 1
MQVNPNILLIVIDSFCGGGGTTTGFHRAQINGENIAKVVIGINHDAMAIASHAANHPDTVHFVEDFTTLDPHRLVDIVAAAKLRYPNAKVLFWASAECTHHSKAKGGLPRDADSRSLPEHIERYVSVLDPDIIGVENVIEFIDWGPLSEAGKPIREQKGVYYNTWRDNLLKYGYTYDYQKLNAADYGAYTSRSRYFGLFAKDEVHIRFPEQTHSKTGADGFEKWKAVKDVLQLDVEGESIFGRKKQLVDATLERILNGVIRFVLGGTNDFLIKWNSMQANGKYKAPSVDEPSPTVTTQNRLGLVKCSFLQVAYSGAPWSKNLSVNRPARTITTVDHHQMITAYYGNGYNSDVCDPCGTVTTKDRFALVTSRFQSLMTYNSPGLNTPVTEPCGTVTTKDRFALVTSKFLDEQYGNGSAASIDKPCGTLLTNPKQRLVSAQWLLNPQFHNKGASIEKPCFTLIARMDKMPPYLMQANHGHSKIRINESDTETMIKLKNLCNEYGITDIFMRMLFIDELKRIMGFGDDYILKGTKAEQKKFIGNAVECTQSQVNAEAVAMSIYQSLLKQAI